MIPKLNSEINKSISLKCKKITQPIDSKPKEIILNIKDTYKALFQKFNKALHSYALKLGSLIR